MTPSRIIDRQFNKVRIKRASGTDNAVMFRRLNGMLDTFYAMGRLDLLDAIARGIITPMEAWDAFRASDLDRLASAETIRLLWDTEGQAATGALELWRAAGHMGVRHRAAIKTTWTQLRKLSRADATIADLPVLVAKYRDHCAKLGHARSFNIGRAHVQAFLRDTLGRSHRISAKVADVGTIPVTRAEGHPMTVAQLDALVAALPPKAAQAARDMALTGMGQDEYWGEWTAYAHHVAIAGTKRSGRVRLVPKVADGIGRPALHRRTFEDAMRAVTRSHVAYDLRRTFAHLMEEAAIPRARRKLYLGHKAGDVTDLYERHEVAAYLVRDGALLRAYLEAERTRIEAQSPEMSHDATVYTNAVPDGKSKHGAELPLLGSNQDSPDPESSGPADTRRQAPEVGASPTTGKTPGDADRQVPLVSTHEKSPDRVVLP